MICPNCEENIPVDRDLKISRLHAQDGMEADLWWCPHCEDQFLHFVQGPWQVTYEDHKRQTRHTTQIGYSAKYVLGQMAVRVLGWTLLNASQSSTYD